MPERAKLTIHDLTEQIPRNPNYKTIPIRAKPPTAVVWHCDDAPNWDVWALLNYDFNANHISKKGCPCPTYTFWIDRKGKVYKIAQEAYVTWHAGVNLATRLLHHIEDWNQTAIAICFSFDPDTQSDLTKEQYKAGDLLTAEIMIRRNMQSNRLFGHRELAGTGYKPGYPDRLLKTCPGLAVDMAAARLRIHKLKLDMMSKALAIEVTRIA